MAIERITGLFTSLGDKISEQEWFQDARGKYEELDPQSRANLRIGILAGGGLLVAYFMLSFIWGVHALKKEVTEKQELLTLIQSANDEVRKIKEVHPNLQATLDTSNATSGTPAPADDWNGYFEQTATQNGIDKTAVAITPPKAIATPGATAGAGSNENVYDVAVKHVSIKQIVRFAFALENGAKPVKLRNLSISTHSDPTGYMDATLSVSAFNLASK